MQIGSNLADIQYDYGVLLQMQGKWDLPGPVPTRLRDQSAPRTGAQQSGTILERTRNFEAALDEYRLAVESQPTFRLARFNLGRALIALGRPAEAVVELSRITEPRDAEAPQYLFALGVANIRAGNLADGIRWANDGKRLATSTDRISSPPRLNRN